MHRYVEQFFFKLNVAIVAAAATAATAAAAAAKTRFETDHSCNTKKLKSHPSSPVTDFPFLSICLLYSCDVL